MGTCSGPNESTLEVVALVPAELGVNLPCQDKGTGFFGALRNFARLRAT